MHRTIEGGPVVESEATHTLVCRRRGLVAIAATLGLAVALFGGTQLGTAAAAPFTWSGVTGVPITLPANAGSEPKALFGWGVCPTVGSCAGVGSYTDTSGNEEALAATRTSGSWGQASEIPLPAGAATSSQKAGFGFDDSTVACTGPGACVAVGHYLKEGGNEEAMAVNETGGVWGTASEIKPPANAATNPEAYLRSVACPASGSCVAVGGYHDENGYREAMVAQETGGSWGIASEIKPPANAATNPEARIYWVDCSAAGSCVAFGEYRDGSTGTEEAMVATETGEVWGQASQITLPPDAASSPNSELDSLVCVAEGPCVAVGKYTDTSGHQDAIVTEETGGVWGTASEITPPANAAGNPEAGFGISPVSIACTASGSCVIIGKYTDSSSHREAMVAQQTAGSWGQASEIKPPANAAGNPEATLYPACPASGSCVAVGAYTDEGGDREAMVTEATGGLWGQAIEVAAPVNAESNPRVIFGEVMCPASGSCIAFGEYTNNAGKSEDMEVTGLTAPENTVAPTVSGTAKAGQALTCSEGTWTGSPSYAYEWLRDGVAIGGAELSSYTVTVADEGHSISCEVTATNILGSKSAASGNRVAVREEAREKREEEATAKKHEAEAAATAKKHQEEAAVIAKRKEEEAKITATGNVSLAGSTISIQSAGKGSVKLICTGTATCAGKLTLTVKGKAKKGKKAKVETIGTAAFSIPAGKAATVTLTLTAAGRALLKFHHGKLSASLTILKSSPTPASTQHESVQLVQKAAKAKKRKK